MSQTEQLKSQIEQQLNRLLKQLQDCEDLKEELDEEEYELTKDETFQQMKEFEETLKKMTHGDLTLASQFESAKLAMQAAVSKAFQTPEVIKLFAKSQPKQLRIKLEELKREQQLGKVPKDVYTRQTLEILSALQKLGEELSATEKSFLNDNMTQEMKKFVNVESAEDVGKQSKLLSQAGSQIQQAQK